MIGSGPSFSATTNRTEKLDDHLKQTVPPLRSYKFMFLKFFHFPILFV